MHENSNPSQTRIPWLWVLGGFLFQTIPATLRDEVLPIALKNHGVNDETITQIVGVLGLIVALKIFYAPILSLCSNPRRLILSSQAGQIFCILILSYFVYQNQTYASAVILIIMMLLSGGHDYLLDGYFVHSLNETERAKHSGLLNLASKLGPAIVGAVLILIAGIIGNNNASIALLILALLSFGVLILNRIGFAREPVDQSSDNKNKTQVFNEMVGAIKSLARDRRLPVILGLIFFYRASEVHMNHVVKLFAKADINQGGLGLSDLAYYNLRFWSAIPGLALGGLIGSAVVTKRGLARSLIPLGVCMHLPLIGIAWLSFHVNPAPSIIVIWIIFFIEYLAFGAGLCALILAMMKLAAGPQAAVRYALLSTLSLVAVYLPGLWAGKLSNILGYSGYFIAALALAIPGIVAAILAAKKLEEA